VRGKYAYGSSPAQNHSASSSSDCTVSSLLTASQHTAAHISGATVSSAACWFDSAKPLSRAPVRAVDSVVQRPRLVAVYSSAASKQL
jgi:hypothetical protein